MVHLSGVVGSIAFAIGGVALLFRRSLPLPAAVILWHAAGAGMAVSLAASERLAGKTTWLLGKRQDGSISPLSTAAFWPYHLGLRTKLAIQRRVSTEPAWSQVTDTYYIGAWPSEEALVPTVHPAVLDVTAELPLQLQPPAYKVLHVWDTHSPSPSQIEDGVAWARQQARSGRKVLVHCAHGHGRSATLLGAILIADGVARSVDEAVMLMKAQRPRVRLNRRQLAALKAWAAEHGKAE